MMKTTIQLKRMILVALSFMLLLLAGCGGGGGQATFSNDKVAGKTFAYAQTSGTTGATGALAFNADGTWRSALGANVFSGTWTVDANGKLVCVTTAGGNHTVTYTLLDSTASAMSVSAVEINPADPNNPTSYNASFTVAFTAEMIAGHKLSYSSVGGSTGSIQFAHDGSWRTVTNTATYIGTWSIVGGKLVCVTTTGGNHTITYTRLDATTDPISTSASEVNPADPSNPVISNVTFKDLSGLATVFTNDKVAGKTFAYAQTSGTTGATGALAFNADGTWRSALGATVFSGTWTVDANGKLVCVTTAGGNHTVTHTLIDSTASALSVSAVEINPADPNNPTSYNASFTVAFTVEMIAGHKLSYSSGSGSTGVIEFGHDGSWRTVTDAATYIGTWSIVGGKLVCVTTTGGNHTITYTLVNSITNEMDVSVVEVDPANPTNPLNYTATFKTNTLATVVAPGTFVLNVTFKNLPNSLPQTASTTPNYTITPKRRQWVAMVPIFEGPSGGNAQTDFNDGYTPDTNNPSSVYGVQLYPNGIPVGTPAAGPIGTPSSLSETNAYTPNPVSGITASFGYVYGHTMVIQTIDNYFYFDVTYPTTTGSGHFSTPLLGFLIWSTPASSTWVYDYANNTMTQTQ